MEKKRIDGIPPVVLKILESRGITGDDDIEEFVSPRPKLAYDPFLLANMRAGVDLLLDAVDSGKNIVIYGDYDCDGVTSTALMMKVLRCLTDRVSWYIPSRTEEGYGLHSEAIDRIHERGGEFILTVDCGAVSRAETDHAHELGIGTLVTDHHTVKDEKASGTVIDPKAPGETYPFIGLAGVGVAYKLALAISRERDIPRSLITEVLELVTLGTVADVMPLTDENRTIVKYGLRLMRSGCVNRGLRRLIETAGLDFETLKASNISFGIAPRINAAGRMGDASIGVKLLLAETDDEIERCCRALEDANSRRRAYQDEAFEDCSKTAEKELEKGDFLIFEAGEGAHEGILGIVAGKIKDRYRRPTVILSKKDGELKGTGRSVERVDLFRMLNKYRDLFTRFGGHSAACGFTLPEENYSKLKEGLNRDIAAMKAEDPSVFEEEMVIDAEIRPEEATLELAEAVQLFEPCGAGNEAPVFMFRDIFPEDWRDLGNDGRYGKFTVWSGSGPVEFLIFHDTEKVRELYRSGGSIDVSGSLEINTWKDRSRVQVIVSSAEPSRKAVV
jgi:single-stranded-DNA-specific exonuclease